MAIGTAKMLGRGRGTGLSALALLLLFGAVSSACTPKRSPENSFNALPSIGSILLDPTSSIGADPQSVAAWAASLGRETPQRPSEEFLWALSACVSCAAGFQSAYFADQAAKPGVLPQILVPQVRKEVRENRLLGIVTGLGAAVGGLINASMFDGKVKSAIRGSLVKKISASLNHGTQLNDQSPFSFDVFVPGNGATTVAGGAGMGIQGPGIPGAESLPMEFALAEIAPRWNLLLAAEGLWSGAPGDHGFVTLQLMKMMVEWQYLFGLESDGAGGNFGGLTVAPGELPAGQPLRWDPRQPGTSATPRIVSGLARIAYAPGAAVDMAKSARETWSVRDARGNLNEQAQIWTAAARAFERLRPRNRSHVQKFFQPGALFPNDTHQLALAFLLGQSALLKGPIIDESARRVREAAESPQSGPQRDAAPLANARLLRSLMSWRRALTDVSDAGLSPDTQRQVADAPRSLLRAGQLVVQKIMLGAFERDAEGNTRILRDRGAHVEASPGEAAEILATLIESNREGFQSSYLDGKLSDALGAFRRRWLANAQALQSLSAVDLVWLRVLGQQALLSPAVAAAHPWLAELQGALLPAFAGLEGGAR